MTPPSELLAQARALVAKATPGPLTAFPDFTYNHETDERDEVDGFTIAQSRVDWLTTGFVCTVDEEHEGDAKLFAAASALLPALADALEELSAENERLRSIVEEIPDNVIEAANEAAEEWSLGGEKPSASCVAEIVTAAFKAALEPKP